MKKVLITILAITIFQNAFTQKLQDHTGTPPWYEESVIHAHHSAGAANPQWEIQFGRVRPDAVHFHPNAYEAGKYLADMFNFAMVTTLNRSGGWKDVLSIIEALPVDEQNLFYRRVNPDGSPAGRTRSGNIVEHLCYYSPGIEKYIYPEYERVTEEYQPAQIWIDHTIVTVNLCYCEICKENFFTEYGIEPPEVGSAPYWNEWVKYHRKGFEL